MSPCSYICIIEKFRENRRFVGKPIFRPFPNRSQTQSLSHRKVQTFLRLIGKKKIYQWGGGTGCKSRLKIFSPPKFIKTSCNKLILILIRSQEYQLSMK